MGTRDDSLGLLVLVLVVWVALGRELGLSRAEVRTGALGVLVLGFVTNRGRA